MRFYAVPIVAAQRNKIKVWHEFRKSFIVQKVNQMDVWCMIECALDEMLAVINKHDRRACA